MSETELDEQFWELADSFIQLANKHMETEPPSRVSATLLYAASRFTAFVVTAGTKNREELSAEKEAAIAYSLEQYEEMLRENLDDHLDNYEKYVV